MNVLKKVASPELVHIAINIHKVEYLGVVCMILITEKPLTPYYVLNLADPNIPFTGVIGMSALVDIEETKGKYITYFPKYITSDHPYWSNSDEELKTIFKAGVKILYPELDDAEIQSASIHKAFKVQPLQVLNYSDSVPKIQTMHPNFYVLNTTQFVNQTLNNDSVVGHVDNFVARFKEELRSNAMNSTKTQI